jgi:uncharacterized protein YodC (DUF2158 family)
MGDERAYSFPVGTIVWLKSGGPPMTVSDFPAPMPNVASVDWFNNGELKQGCFHKDCLVTEEPDHA